METKKLYRFKIYETLSVNIIPEILKFQLQFHHDSSVKCYVPPVFLQPLNFFCLVIFQYLHPKNIYHPTQSQLT